MKTNNLHKNPFKTPEGYFDNFTSNFSKEKLSPSEENSSFKIPNGYFDTVSEKIISKIATEKEVKVIAINKRRYLFYGVASIAAAFLLLFTINFNNNKETSFEELALADIESYISMDAFNISYLEVAEVLEINTISEEIINFEDQEVLQYIEEEIDWDSELNLEEL